MKIQGTNISMIRGDSEAIKVSCRNESGVDFHFAEGDIVYFTVKRSTYTEEKIIQKIVTEFTEGVALINISPKDTRELTIGTYYYDIQLNRANGTVKTIIPPSKFTIDPEVTYD